MRPSRETTLDDTTHSDPPPGVPRGLRIVVVWHRDPARIGAHVWIPWSSAGDSVELSRQEPIFSDGAPLAEHRISRSPLQLLAGPDGLACWPTRDGLRFDLDGRPGTSGLQVSPAALERGVRLGLGRGALLHIRLGAPPLPSPVATLVGASEELERVAAAVASAARAGANVLIRGESGTGKELVAQALHALGPRADRPLVAVNMAALSSALAPSQLFGHARGAFTGADQRTTGLFGAADRGTLFLDEIGACPLDVQALLLRALECGEIQVVGGPSRQVNVRVVSATDADLERACADGAFRAPLYHRLAHVVVHIPPLRARPVDIAVQAAAFFREQLRRRQRAWPEGGEAPWLGREVVEALLRAPWPGNTRELRATVERLVVRDLDQPCCGLPEPKGAPRSPREEDGDRREEGRRHRSGLGGDDARRSDPLLVVRGGPRDARTDAGLPQPGAIPGPLDLVAALTRTGFRLTAAAELLGISRNTLKRRMELENIRRPRDLDRAEIVRALAETTSIAQAAQRLRVSEHGLRLRMGELGLDEAR